MSECQLTDMCKLQQPNSRLNDLFQIRITLIWSARKKGIYLKNKTFRSIMGRTGQGNPETISQTEIMPGDTVKVREKSEIKNILNDWGGTKGCIFTPEMYERCGKTYKVYKKIDHFYDEVKERMCKCKDIYLLEGALCSGKRRMFSENCDRCCFQFWHKDWLEKIETGSE